MTETSAVGLGSARYLNRELSTMAFNARVLAVAADKRRPLLERAKFLAIFATNNDEFFQKRVGGLIEQASTGADTVSPDQLPPSEQLAAVRTYAQELADRQSALFNDEIAPGLAAGGLQLCGWDDLDDDEHDYITGYFDDQVFPVLTPLAIDPGHPFPHISSLSLNLAVVLHEPDRSRRQLARVKVPSLLDRFVGLPGGARYVPIEIVIANKLETLFPGMEVREWHQFRVTRNADLAIRENEAEDLLETIEDHLLERRFGRAVRLELHPSMPDWLLERLRRELDIDASAVTTVDAPLDMSALWQLYGGGPAVLRDPSWEPQVPARLAQLDGRPGAIFSEIAEGDIFVHHPYDSFDASVQRFIVDASRDPAVLAIKVSIYRTTEEESPIVEALIRAAEAEKQAVAMVELKARFDEEANIQRARRLEDAGVHVAYGLIGLKTHSKIALVIREEEGALRRYAHIGTGNYNPSTAKIYEDIGVLTRDPDIGHDLSQLFNTLTGYSRHDAYRRLLVAPRSLRPRMMELIEREIEADDGHIVAKVNNLVDIDMIDAFYDASEAGTPVDLIVRSICCLRPGVRDLSEHIRVRSIVGDFLEHSRIFRFGSPERGCDYLIGSADLMPRNLDRRVEAVLPVTDEDACARLQQILDVEFADDRLAWELDGDDGSWHRVEEGDGVHTHERLRHLAIERADA
ncbi:MAG: polyphosphate kinase 1 [Actinobacteria bacterium]|nr:polyphosphate kinase 1 [Actinomycetota bacterium]